jgi:2-methylcitrate dehydratase PrpD
MQVSIPRRSVTVPLIERVMRLSHDAARPDVLNLIKDCVLDWIGVALVGAREPSAGLLLDELTDQGGHSQATIIGHELQLSGYQAALMNGTSSHTLDYDDVNFAVLGHASAPVLAASLAVAEKTDASGSRFLEAFLIGYETSCRVGTLLAPGHYTRGFHATGTIGCFGAAAACAHLLGLDVSTTAHAFGIAATRSAGLKSMFGTPCKPLHAGMAAATGVLAATMAGRRYTSRPDALEAPQGFAATHSPDFNPEGALDDPPEGLHLFNNLFKLHCACYETQAAIECGLDIARIRTILPESIEKVRLRVNEHCDEICNIAEPKTGMETKFSLRAMAAYALAGIETSRPDVFSDANANAEGLVALRQKVSVELTPNLRLTQTQMEVLFTDGSILLSEYDSGTSIADAHVRHGRVANKFQALSSPIVGSERSGALRATVDRLEGLASMRELTGLLRI